jgi:hypothetical protein
MNKYVELDRIIQKKYDEFPFIFIFAFCKNEFERKLKSYNVTKDEIASIGAGGFVRKKDIPALNKLCEWAHNARKEAIEKDVDGSGFVKDMFAYELNNHEYGYTYNLEDTLNTLGYTYEEIQKDKKLKRGLDLALKKYYYEPLKK